MKIFPWRRLLQKMSKPKSRCWMDKLGILQGLSESLSPRSIQWMASRFCQFSSWIFSAKRWKRTNVLCVGPFMPSLSSSHSWNIRQKYQHNIFLQKNYFLWKICGCSILNSLFMQRFSRSFPLFFGLKILEVHVWSGGFLRWRTSQWQGSGSRCKKIYLP